MRRVYYDNFTLIDKIRDWGDDVRMDWDRIDHTSVPGMTNLVRQNVFHHTATIAGSRIYLIGMLGARGGWPPERVLVCCLDYVKQLWTSTFIPGPWITRHGAALAEDKIYVYGGLINNVTPLDAMWQFDFMLMELSKLPNSRRRPPFRYGATFEFLEGVDRMVLTCGFNQNERRCLNDLWLYNPEENEWMQGKPTGQPPVPCHSQASCASGDTVYCFGGTDGDVVMDTLSLLHSSYGFFRWSIPNLSAPFAPPGRFGASLCFISGKLILYGGKSMSNPNSFKDTAIFDYRKLKWYRENGNLFGDYRLLELKEKTPLRFHAAVASPLKMFVFGGIGMDFRSYFTMDAW